MEKRIELEKRGRNADEIDALILDDCRSTAIVGLTEEYVSLRNLSIINVGLTSLKGFPALPSLVFLDLSENRISNSLQNLSGCTNLRSLNLCQNKLKDIEAIDPLKHLKRLKYLDLSNNEVTKEEGYKEYVIEYFSKTIKCLDGDSFFNGKHESTSDSDEEDSESEEYENGEGGLEDLLKDNIDEESEGNDYVLDEEDGVDQDSSDESDDDAGEADDTSANDSQDTRGKKRKLDE
ncbi:hypothetical protein ACI65C_008751 [Semiaphis heraclei]